jgi:uncharacterized protein Yka (UPF0111/DUF47 family)
MSPIQRFLSEPFFDLLEAGAAEAQANLRLLVQLLRAPAGIRPGPVPTAQNGKAIAEATSRRLVNTLVAGLDREDIGALAGALYAITRSVAQFWERYSLAEERLPGVEFLGLAEAAEQAAGVVVAMVKQLRHFDRALGLGALNDQLSSAEDQADRLVSQALQPLYGGGAGPLQAVLLKDLCEHFEQIMGDCARAAQLAGAIGLKGL